MTEPPPGPDDDSLGRKTRRGIGWNIVAAVATNVVRIASVAILARLLSPRDFGIVAVVVAVTALATVIKDIGVGAALVQRETIDDDHVGTAFAISVYLAGGLGVVLVAIAPLIGRFYDMPEAVDVLRAMSIVFVIKGVAAVSAMLCLRDLNFRLVAILELGAYVAGTVTSIVLAALDAGAWSLVIGYLVEACVAAAFYLALRPPKLILRIHKERARELLGYGLGQTVFQISSALANQGDNLIVGHTLGRAALGFYGRAYDLVRFPANVFTSVVGNVLFPAFSRMQNDPVRLGRAFLRTLFGNAFLLLPFSMLLVVLAPEAIRVLLGPGWDEMVWPFRILTASMLCRTSYKAGAIVARATGDVYAVAVVVTIYAAIVVIGAAIASSWGITGVAISTTTAIVAAYLLLSYVGMRRSDVTWTQFVVVHGPGAAIASLVLVGCWPLAHALRAGELHYVAILAIVSLAAAVLAAAAIGLGVRRRQPDIVWLVDTVTKAIRRRR